MGAALLRLTIAGLPYNVRHLHGLVVGATNEARGVHVGPAALWAIARAAGATDALTALLEDDVRDEERRAEAWRREENGDDMDRSAA